MIELSEIGFDKTRSKQLTLQQIFEEQVDKTPDATAIFTAGNQLTYIELNRKINKLAWFLQKKGVKPNNIIALCLEQSIEQIIVLLAIIKAGAAFLPIDPVQPLARIAYILQDANPTLLITQNTLYQGKINFLNYLFIDDLMILSNAESEENPKNFNKVSHLSYVIYTSGSSGQPKGAGNSHQVLINMLIVFKKSFEISVFDRFLQSISISFDAAIWEIFLPLLSGASLCLSGNSQQNLAKNMLDWNITISLFVPSLLRLFMKQELTKSLNTLRLVFCGGESVTISDIKKFHQLYAIPLINCYGLSETGIISSFYIYMPREKIEQVYIGKPIKNTMFHVLNTNQMVVDKGTVGELYISGAGIGIRALNKNKFCIKNFYTIQLINGKKVRVFKTGDKVRELVNGQYEFLGRFDEQIKIHGNRIDPAEVENTLVLHPAIEQAVVLKIKDAADKDILIGILKSTLVVKPSFNELYHFIKAYVPHAFCPSAIMWIDEFPKTTSGKIDKMALSLLNFNFDYENNIEVDNHRLEDMICDVCSTVLGITSIKTHHNFVALGGTSLDAIQVAIMIRAKGYMINAKHILESPILATWINILKPYEQLPINTPPAAEIFNAKELKDAGFILNQIEDVFPATDLQAGLLFHSKHSKKSGVYINQIRTTLAGELDIDLFWQSCEFIIKHYAILRTGFFLENRVPLQVVLNEISFKKEYFDLKNLPINKKESMVQHYMTVSRERGFVCHQPPLWKVAIFQYEASQFVLVETSHHAIMDGISSLNLYGDLIKTYMNFSQETYPQLAPRYSMKDYVLWRNNYPKAASHEYWQKHMTKITESTKVLVENSEISLSEKPAVYRRYHASFPKKLIQLISDFKSQTGLTTHTLFQAAWGLLLYRYSEQQVVTWGMIESGRNLDLPEIMSRIGLFVNTLPLIGCLLPDTTGKQWLQDIHQQIFNNIENNQLSIEEITQYATLSEKNMLFQTVLGAQQDLISELGKKLGGATTLQVRDIEIFAQTHYPLTVMAYDTYAVFLYDENIFDSSFVQQLSEHWQNLMNALITQADKPVISLNMLSISEKKYLANWQHGKKMPIPEKNIHQLFEEQVANTPNISAILFQGIEISYNMLNIKANQLAKFLISHRLPSESIVVVYLERGINLIISLLAILKAGYTFLPIDVKQPVKRVEYYLNDSKAKITITQKKYSSVISSVECGSSFFCWEDFFFFNGEENGADLNIDYSLSRLAYVIYTSGSSGQPKGVMIEHRSVINYLFAVQKELQLEASDGFLSATSPAFDIVILEYFLPLCVGAKIIIASEEESRLAEKFKILLMNKEVTVFQATPTILEYLFAENWTPKEKLQIISTGEILHPKLAKKLLISHRLFNVYGPTEATIGATIMEILSASLVKRHVTIGRPIHNLSVYVLDKNLQALPIGVVGELYIGGTGVARGYLGRLTLTNEKFIKNPFKCDERIYKTGDYVYWDKQGKLVYVERMDDQVKVRGNRVDLKEIEQVLIQHPFVKQAKIIYGINEHCRAEEQKLFAYIIPNEAPKLSTRQRNINKHERISSWNEIYNNIYGCPSSAAVPFALAGWRNSLTGQHYTSDEMHEWRDDIIDKILKIHPKRILDIGCGTGMIMFPLLPLCKEYLAADFSEQVIAMLKNMLETNENRTKVTLFHQPAEQLLDSVLTVDTIILNSVIQYFPDISYLQLILEKSIKKISDSGQIIIGDIRNLSWLNQQDSWKKILGAKADGCIRDFVTENIFENELLVSPQYFLYLKTIFPMISAVEIMLKNGKHATEMNAFRYDVILHINKSIQVCDIKWEVLNKEASLLSQLDKKLLVENSQKDILGFKQLPNAWLIEQNVHLNNCDSLLVEREKIYPYEIYNLAKERGYAVLIMPCFSQTTLMNVVFYPHIIHSHDIAASGIRDNYTLKDRKNLNIYVNDPLSTNDSHIVIRAIKKYLTQRLPLYMVPDHFVILSSFPKSSTGKLDKTMLLQMVPFNHKVDYVLPRNDIEKILYDIWRSFFGTEKICIHDNFFDIGGHSLMAMQLVSRMRQHFNLPILLADFTKHVSIATLARRILQMREISVVASLDI